MKTIAMIFLMAMVTSSLSFADEELSIADAVSWGKCVVKVTNTPILFQKGSWGIQVGSLILFAQSVDNERVRVLKVGRTLPITRADEGIHFNDPSMHSVFSLNHVELGKMKLSQFKIESKQNLEIRCVNDLPIPF